MIAFIVVAASAVFALGLQILNGPAIDALRYAGIPLLVAYAGWLLWAGPQLRVDSAGLVAKNPLTTTRIPWHAITEVGSAWGLFVRTQDRKWDIWAAPQRSRFAGRKANGPGVRVPSHADDVIREDLGASQAASMIREEWLDRQKRESPTTSDGNRPEHNINVLEVGALVVLLGIAALPFII